MLEWRLYRDHFSSLEMRTIWSEEATISGWIETAKIISRCQAELGLIAKIAA